MNSDMFPAQLVTASTGYLVLRIGDSMRERMESVLSQWGLTGRDLRVLSFAYAQPSSQRELCERAGLDRTTMVGVIDKLETLGYAQRERGSDRRTYVVTLTGLGRSTVEAAVEQLANAEAEFLQPIDAADREHFHRLLQQLFQAHDPSCQTP